MISVYVGKIGVPESTLVLGFDTFKDASDFCDTLKNHYKEQTEVLYMAIDRTREFEALELMFKDSEIREEVEIDAEVFGKLLEMQERAGRRSHV